MIIILTILRKVIFSLRGPKQPKKLMIPNIPPNITNQNDKSNKTSKKLVTFFSLITKIHIPTPTAVKLNI